MTADVYLCGQEGHQPADVIVRVTGPCVVVVTPPAGSGGRVLKDRELRQLVRPKPPQFIWTDSRTTVIASIGVAPSLKTDTTFAVTATLTATTAVVTRAALRYTATVAATSSSHLPAVLVDDDELLVLL